MPCNVRKVGGVLAVVSWSKEKRMKRFVMLLLAGSSLAACQTAPGEYSGFLSNYEGLSTRTDTLRASIRERRDDAAVAGLASLYIEPAVMLAGADSALNPAERAQILREVDRQVCYEVSERFSLATSPAGSARLRVGITDVIPTGQAASGVSAVANAFIPGPGTLRVPGSTGGLAAEAELLDADGRQLAALAWARNANVVGTDTPSLSRVGDAMQLAKPFGDAVREVLSEPKRPGREIPDPDPCAGFGARIQPAGFLTRVVTGLYVPEVYTSPKPPEPGPQESGPQSSPQDR